MDLCYKYMLKTPAFLKISEQVLLRNFSMACFYIDGLIEFISYPPKISILRLSEIIYSFGNNRSSHLPGGVL